MIRLTVFSDTRHLIRRIRDWNFGVNSKNAVHLRYDVTYVTSICSVYH